MNKTMIAFVTALTLGAFAVPAFAGDTKTETKSEESANADGSSAKKSKKTKKKNADGSTTTTEKTEKTETK